MPLLKGGRLIDDAWTFAADDAVLPPAGPVAVSLERWRRDRSALLDRGGPLGVRLGSAHSATEIADDLGRFDLVALHFPAFTDGRPYSVARRLRQRYGFGGEIRATGEVLVDQYGFLLDCGFDAFAVADAVDAAEWETAAERIGETYRQSWSAEPGRRAVA